MGRHRCPVEAPARPDPTLVATVKGHAGYEKGTLESVVQARNRAASAGGPAAASEAEGALAAQVRQIFALAEAYPDSSRYRSESAV